MQTKTCKKIMHSPQSPIFWERKNLQRLNTILPSLFPCSLIAFINSICPYTHFKDFVAMGIYFHILLSRRKMRFWWLNVTEALTFAQPNQIYSLKKKSVYVFEIQSYSSSHKKVHMFYLAFKTQVQKFSLPSPKIFWII